MGVSSFNISSNSTSQVIDLQVGDDDDDDNDDEAVQNHFIPSDLDDDEDSTTTSFRTFFFPSGSYGPGSAAAAARFPRMMPTSLSQPARGTTPDTALEVDDSDDEQPFVSVRYLSRQNRGGPFS